MKTIHRHILFWLVIFLVWTFIKSNGGERWQIFSVVNIINITIYVIAFYVLKHVQIPHLLNRGRIVSFAISILVISMILFFIWRLNGVIWMDEFRGYKKYPFFNWVNYVTNAIQFYSPAVVLLLWDNHIEGNKERERIQQLEKEKLSTELKYLKAQLNPHFLFNTLNNLYSQVLLQSSKAPDMILQLSGILDYVLYRSQEQTVTLNEEIEIIEHFLSLEKIRYDERLEVDFIKTGNLDVDITPLLFLSLVENAFKHGVSSDNNKSIVKITIKVEPKSISCKVWNTTSTYRETKSENHTTGIGLTNIKRQLNLIYPNKHQLEIDQTENSFCILVNILR